MKAKVRKQLIGSNTCHYLRVFYKDKKKYIQFDHGLPQLAEDNEQDFLEEYHLISRITKPVEVSQIKVSVKWRDEEGEFLMEARNTYSLKRIFEMFPRVLRALKS